MNHFANLSRVRVINPHSIWFDAVGVVIAHDDDGYYHVAIGCYTIPIFDFDELEAVA